MFQLDFQTLQKKINGLTITVLPDFYLDVIVNPNMSYEKLMEGIDSVFQRGGGNLLGPKIEFVAGGNGGNVAKIASVLGANTYFVCKTSHLGRVLVEFYLKKFGVKTIINNSGSVASSVILEIPFDKQKHNVMLSSSGSVGDFAYSELNTEQKKALYNSDIIAITNAQNLRMENLVEGILNNVKDATFVSIDFSDLTPHKKRLGKMRKDILDHPFRRPNMVSGNENEIKLLAGTKHSSASEAAMVLSERYNSIIFGLHQADHAEIWMDGKQEANERCFNIDVLRATGAGDTWHAGFIISHKAGLSTSEAAKFANAVAAYQISKTKVGSLKEIYDFTLQTKTY